MVGGVEEQAEEEKHMEDEEEVSKEEEAEEEGELSLMTMPLMSDLMSIKD